MPDGEKKVKPCGTVKEKPLVNPNWAVKPPPLIVKILFEYVNWLSPVKPLVEEPNAICCVGKYVAPVAILFIIDASGVVPE